MQAIANVVDKINGILWGIPTLILLIGTGLILTFALRFIQFRKFGEGVRRLLKGGEGEGEVTPFAALCVALASCIGTGNIVGVAIAITLGGPGALLWMIITALVGMATIYAESTMAVKFRKIEDDGSITGGPFYYIEKGIGWKWLAVFFAVATVFSASLGTGSLTQIGSITSAINNVTQNLSPSISVFGNEVTYIAAGLSIFIAAASGFIIMGGLKSISSVATKIVPFMAGFYLLAGAIILITNASAVPGAIGEIISGAFSVKAVAGGAAGGTLMLAMRHGAARGVFSNEAGLGTNPIAAAAARTTKPAHQGLVSMIGVFIDTIMVCTMTGLVVVLTGAHTLGLKDVAITNAAFAKGMSFAPNVGIFIVTGGLIVFAFTTIIGWCYYGERSFAYLFGENRVIIYKYFYITVLFIGIFVDLSLIISIADMFNALMILPNLIGILYLIPVILKESSDYLPGYNKK